MHVRAAAAAARRAAVRLVLGGLTASAVGVGAVVARSLGGTLDVGRLASVSEAKGREERTSTYHFEGTMGIGV